MKFLFLLIIEDFISIINTEGNILLIILHKLIEMREPL